MTAPTASKPERGPAQHQGTTCPLCRHRATREEILVTRPGQGTVLRTLVRCWRRGRTFGGKPPCPVTVESEVPVLETGRPAWTYDSPDHCQDCGQPIEPGHGRKYCQTCKRERHRAATRDSMTRLRAAQAEAPPAQEDSMKKTADPPEATAPTAPRVRVLDLAQRALESPGTGSLVRAILDLTPERQDLLRRLLEDEEVAA